MAGSTHTGGCHCGALHWRFQSGLDLTALAPRACDCDFCQRHAAAWVSDAGGELHIEADGARLQRYRQGSGQAEFLLCGDCGVLVAVIARDGDGRPLGAVNRHAFDTRDAFDVETVVSPQRLDPAAKRERWMQLWTPATLGPRRARQ